MTSQITITPISPPAESSIDFGAVVSNVDIENISGKILNAYICE
jgi:hypothetical protein